MKNRNKKAIASFELSLMVVSIFAFAFIIHEATPVSAQSSEFGCCSETTFNEKCAAVYQDECRGDSQYASGSACEQTSFCQTGCCYDDATGIYDSNVIKGDCKLDWNDDPHCNLPGAEKGCCVLDSFVAFETQGQCSVDSLALSLGGDAIVDWRRDLSEWECLALIASEEEGACVLAGGTCKRSSEVDCYNYGGDFSKGYLCTSSSLETDCEKTEQTTCVEGKDGVYFVDSCGNPANIYDSSIAENETYWDKIIDVENSCGFGSEDGNCNSTSCGNCDRFDGGMCASVTENDFEAELGNYYCRDLSCEFDGENYKNGESWCVYDAYVGDSRDAVGSRYWRYICSQGGVLLEPCADYRNELCAEENVEGFSTSQCRINLASGCFSLGTAECAEEPDCRTESVYVDDFFSFEACVPKYPKGFDLNSDEGKANGETICSLGTQTCTIIYIRDSSLRWECVENCDCEKQIFWDQMKKFCITLGDCEGSVRIWEESNRDSAKQNTEKNVPKYLSTSNTTGEFEGMGFLISNLYINYRKYIMEWDDMIKEGAPGENSFRAFVPGINPSSGGPLSITTPLNLGHVINAVIMAWAGVGDAKEKTVTFTCKPWQPPIGAEDCEKCNEDPLKPCSEYRCSSLGAGCEIVNKGTENEMCDSAKDDGKPPQLVPGESSWENVTYGDISDDGFRITSIEGGCLDAYTNLEFGITTNELSQCRFDLEMKDFENMTLDFGSTAYTYEHTANFFLPDPSHGQSQGLNWTGGLEFFIKCRDRFGHESPGFYNVELCVKEGPDRTAPRIRGVYPDNERLIGFNVSSINATLVTNELSTCRWDHEDVGYSTMANEMICDYSFASPSSYLGYVCSEDFPTPEANNTFYIKCADQPWLENTAEVGDRNANVESFVYALSKPDRHIAIDYVGPSGAFESATAETRIELEVQTSGGGDVHVCSYSLSESGWLIEMWETGEGEDHRQEIYVGTGEQKVRVNCEDETGDSASDYTEFEIIHDTSTPQVARVWQKSGRLYVVTTEDAECRYSTETCKFNWADGSSAGSGDEHIISVIRGESYYIKCKDEFGNVPSGCSVEIRVL